MTLVEEAVEDVRREVAYVETAYASFQHACPPRAHLTSWSAMSYVVGRVSAPEYGWANTMGGGAAPQTPEDILRTRQAICGGAAATMGAVVKGLGLPARSVQFFDDVSGDNHIAVEVGYGGTWHYFDPTWGAVFLTPNGRVMGMAAARKLSAADAAAALEYDRTLFWRRTCDELGALDMLFVVRKKVRVVVGAVPF